MNTLADPDLLAGEFVLGVLEDMERADVEKRAAEDPAFAAAIRLWELRLGPLHELVLPVEPPNPVWPSVVERLDSVPQPERRQRRALAKAVAAVSEATGPDAAALGQRLRRWRATAILAGALALSLVGFFLSQVLREVTPGPRLVGLLQPEGQAATIGITVDLRTRTVTVRPSAPPPAGRSYEVWLVVGEPPTPFVLGRARGEAVLRASVLARVGDNQLRDATLGAVVVPTDSTPTSEPSGPFTLTGRLVSE
jgi:anti-sigma-K factor RskA